MYSVIGTWSVFFPSGMQTSSFWTAKHVYFKIMSLNLIAIEWNESKWRNKKKKSVVISLWRSLVLLQVVMLFSFCIHSYTISPDTEKHFFTMIDKESVSCYTLCLRVLRVFRDLHAVCFDFSSANPAIRSVSLQTVCPHLKSMCYSRTIKYNKSVPYVGTQCQ